MAAELIKRALTFVRDKFESEYSGHDYFHTLRVFNMATHIAEREEADSVSLFDTIHKKILAAYKPGNKIIGSSLNEQEGELTLFLDYEKRIEKIMIHVKRNINS